MENQVGGEILFKNEYELKNNTTDFAFFQTHKVMKLLFYLHAPFSDELSFLRNIEDT